MVVKTALLPFLCLFGASSLMALKTAMKKLPSKELDEKFFKSGFTSFLFKNKDFLNLSEVITFIGYGASGALALCKTNSSLLQTIALLLAFALPTYLIFHLFASQVVIATLKLFSLISSIYLILLFPIIYPFVWFERKLSPRPFKITLISPSDQLKKRLNELLQEAELQNLLDPTEKKLVSSLAQFGDLVAREIMIPRPDMLCLPASTTIYDSLQMFIKEGYSRIPLYGESIDDITSVLLYKDVMEFCVDALEKGRLDTIKSTPVSTLSNEILYAPENKKIRDLFQEMRVKKIHATIVVNEYGCTEGLITIEDILEELVGSEIRDEHDEGEETLYKETPDKSFIVDATMSIIDVEKELNIQIPHGPEYETIAGYISLQAGCIPKPGMILHGENFHIEVLKSDERQISEVKITPEKRETLDL